MSQRQGPQRRGQKHRDGLRTRNGFSKFELIVSIVVLGVGLGGLASAGTKDGRQPGEDQAHVEFWAAVQTVGDSLQQSGYGAVTEGSRTVGSYSFRWTVDRSTANLHKVTLVGASDALADTVLLYMANPNGP